MGAGCVRDIASSDPAASKYRYVRFGYGQNLVVHRCYPEYPVYVLDDIRFWQRRAADAEPPSFPDSFPMQPYTEIVDDADGDQKILDDADGDTKVLDDADGDTQILDDADGDAICCSPAPAACTPTLLESPFTPTIIVVGDSPSPSRSRSPRR